MAETNGARSGPLRSVQEHTGGCPYSCPLCTLYGLLRQIRPEVAAHLNTAAAELLAAARALLDPTVDQDAAEGLHAVDPE